MFEGRDRILDQLRAGEDGRAEFKEVRFGNRGVVSPNTEELADELVAFANAEGGAVFLGVDDSGAVRGIPPARIDAVEHWVLNVATHNCDPPIRPILRKALLPGDGGDDRRVLLAEVPRGLYVHRTSGRRYYARLGSTKRDLTPPELVRLFQQRGRGYVFDEQPVLAAAVDDLNRHRLEAFFGRSPAIPWLDLLRNTRVTYRDEDGVDRPTVAGLLVFGTEPADFLPSGSIEAACYRGTRLSSDDLIHAERLAGPGKPGVVQVKDELRACVAGSTWSRQAWNNNAPDTPAGTWAGRGIEEYGTDTGAHLHRHRGTLPGYGPLRRLRARVSGSTQPGRYARGTQ